MKTNQIMEVAIGNGTLTIEHKTMMGSLTDLVKIGNSVRGQELSHNGTPKAPFNLAQFLKTKACKDYISHLQRDEGIEKPLMVKQRGKGKGTYGHLYLMLYIAQNISDRFTTQVIKVFVHDQILQLRDQGGNDFKRLNRLIDTLEDRTKELRPKGNRGCYIQVSKMLREKIFTKEELESVEGNIWNSSLALKHHQELREELETKLVSAIELGLIKTYDHLKEVIEGL